MEQIVTLSDDELSKLEENVKELLSSSSKKCAKKKFMIFGKLMLSAVLVSGGVAVAILFPSPITIAALGGAAALVGGGKGAFREIKNVKKENKRRKDGKEELKTVEHEITKRKEIRDLTAAPRLYPAIR